LRGTGDVLSPGSTVWCPPSGALRDATFAALIRRAIRKARRRFGGPHGLRGRGAGEQRFALRLLLFELLLIPGAHADDVVRDPEWECLAALIKGLITNDSKHLGALRPEEPPRGVRGEHVEVVTAVEREPCRPR
jgi:hypothetical protein